jgi:hypothetical protein
VHVTTSASPEREQYRDPPGRDLSKWGPPNEAPGADAIDRPPNLPFQFQMKLLVDAWYPVKGRVKILVLFHYDYINQRTREDLYRIKEGKDAKRYFTQIKRFDEGISYMVMHRVRDGPTPNPAACMSVATKGKIFHPSLLHYHGIYTGPESISLHLSLEGEEYSPFPTETWGMKYKNMWYKYYESPVTRKPVRISWRNFNASVIHFDEGPETVKPNMFEVRSVTAMECTEFARPL